MKRQTSTEDLEELNILVDGVLERVGVLFSSEEERSAAIDYLSKQLEAVEYEYPDEE